MHSCRSRRLAPMFAAIALAASCVSMSMLSAQAATPVTVTSKVPFDGPIRYTVKVVSKRFGNAQDTRAIRSGETDDFTWKTVPPGGPVPAAQSCPDYSSLPLDANGAMIRQTQIRLAPIVAENGAANVQLSFQAQSPRGKKNDCPDVASYSQVVRFSMQTNGSAKTLTLSDGTQVTVSAQR